MNTINDFRRTRVKICGLTRKADAQCAADLGVDAIGLVFYPPSPRAVAVDQALEIVSTLPPFVSVVALFVDERPERVQEVIEKVPVDLIQFHGDEPADFCSAFKVPYIKAIRMDGRVDLGDMEARYASARGLLLDAWHPDHKGGTGLCFDWTQISHQARKPIILAGGLNAQNASQALALTKPYGLDVSSGVEVAKGLKDPEKIAAFVNEVQRFDATAHEYRTA